MTNDLLRTRREMMPSPSGSGAPMSRSELAEAVNEYIRTKTGRASGLRREEVWRWERGIVRWPGKHYREALRAILGAESDEEFGFVPGARSRSGLTVQALIRREGHLLVVRRGSGQWSSLPGGHVRAGRPVQSSLLSHVAEQTGLEATIVGFAGGVEHHRADDMQHAITLVFEAHATHTGTTDRAADGVRWLAVEDLAHHDVRPVALRDALIDGADGAFWRAWTL